MGLSILALADRPELIPGVARWHWDEWGEGDPGGSLEAWTEGLRRRSQRDRIPTSWVAMLDREPVGCVALVDHDMAIRRELSPWLSGLFVVPAHRAGGVGASLTAHCEAAAAELGVGSLYLYTSTAEGFYRRRGWEVVAREPYGREEVAVMTKDVGGSPQPAG